MKKMILLLLLVFVGVLAWRIGEKLSSDAISMGIGVLFGVLAGVPAALLVMAGARRREPEFEARRGPHRGAAQPYPPQFAPQPPVIVLTGPGGAAPHMGHPGGPGAYAGPPDPAWPQPSPTERRFKVVGEQEEWIDEW